MRTAHERGEEHRIGQREKFNNDTAATELGWSTKNQRNVQHQLIDFEG